ncbi:MAG: hypothetical protein A2V64_06160 [Bacteroidetes bacterium RBG_13_43_22]|nr:MAG: hypothetical protein A2V64_06160 [Bacteroidetes bacterium RBG_13_43_22]
MKSNSKSKYSGISSFEDFRIEKEQLNFRNELIEAKLKLTYLKVTEKFSVSNLFGSLAREFVLPKVSDFLGDVIKKVGKDTHSEVDSSQSEPENSQQE